jgi:hypothetical protein
MDHEVLLAKETLFQFGLNLTRTFSLNNILKSDSNVIYVNGRVFSKDDVLNSFLLYRQRTRAVC